MNNLQPRPVKDQPEHLSIAEQFAHECIGRFVEQQYYEIAQCVIGVFEARLLERQEILKKDLESVHIELQNFSSNLK